MPKTNPNKKIQKRRTEDEMRQALHDFVLISGGVEPLSDDAYIVLVDTVEELLEARQTLEEIRGFVQVWHSRLSRR